MQQTHSPSLTPGGPRLCLALLRRDAERRAAAGLPPFSADSALLLAMGHYGENAIALADAFPGRVTCIDEDAEGILHARSEARKLPRLRALVASPLATGFERARFDLVILEGVLSFYPPRKALGEALRLLAPGGAIGVADCAWLSAPVPAFARDAWETPRRRVPAMDEIEALLGDAGLRVLQRSDESRLLDAFYRQFSGEAKRLAASDDKHKHRKALAKQYKHEIDVYLKLGGRKHMGYFTALAVPR